MTSCGVIKERSSASDIFHSVNADTVISFSLLICDVLHIPPMIPVDV